MNLLYPTKRDTAVPKSRSCRTVSPGRRTTETVRHDLQRGQTVRHDLQRAPLGGGGGGREVAQQHVPPDASFWSCVAVSGASGASVRPNPGVAPRSRA